MTNGSNVDVRFASVKVGSKAATKIQLQQILLVACSQELGRRRSGHSRKHLGKETQKVMGRGRERD